MQQATKPPSAADFTTTQTAFNSTVAPPQHEPIPSNTLLASPSEQQTPMAPLAAVQQQQQANMATNQAS